MHDVSQLPHNLDRDAGTCRAIVETPKGRRGKYDYDPSAGLFRLHKLLPEGMSFPLDFGFIPSTLAEDGDPLDVMILSEEPSPVGALLEVRLIGVLEAEEDEDGQTERNDRLLAVPLVSFLYAPILSAEHLDKAFVDHLTDFWTHKAQLEGKAFRLLRISGPEAAIGLVRKTAKAAKAA